MSAHRVCTVHVCVATLQPFEAWQAYDALNPALIPCEAQQRAPLRLLSEKLKAPSISLAAGGFLLADILQRSRQTLTHLKTIITVAVLC